MTTFNGTLEITIADAQLAIPQHLSRQDPYCVVTLGSSGLKNLMEGERLGKEKFQTKVHNGAGQHPIWNETHSLSLKNMTFDSHLKVKVYDKDVMKDDYLGVAKVNLDQLLQFDNKGVQYFPVFKKGTLGLGSTPQSIGQVGVAIRFNCTEIPTGRPDLKSQMQEAMTRKDQAPMGVQGAYQQAHPAHLGGPQQSVPSTYQGPVQSILPPTMARSDEIQTHHKLDGVTGAALGTGALLGAGTGAVIGHGITGASHTQQPMTAYPSTLASTSGVTQPTVGSSAYGSTVTTFNGTIDITISDAKILIAQHLSKQDPYCVVTLGSGGLKTLMEGESLTKEKFQTKVHNNAGQRPIWNETHALSLRNMKLDSVMKVRLYDKDLVKDDYIGVTKITLGELLAFDKKGVQYLPLWKKGALQQTTSEQIGQVGVGVVFNCTEIPQMQSDMKSQVTDTMIRKEHQLGGMSGPYQTAQQSHIQGSGFGPTIGSTDLPQQSHVQGFPQQTQTVNQPIIHTKPLATLHTTPQTQGQVYGHGQQGYM